MSKSTDGNPFSHSAFVAEMQEPRVPRCGPPPYRKLTDFSPDQQRLIEGFIEAGEFAPLGRDGELLISWFDLEPYSVGDTDPSDWDPDFYKDVPEAGGNLETSR